MQCPKCGYHLDSPTASCPRCALLGDAPAPPQPQQSLPPAAPQMPQPTMQMPQPTMPMPQPTMQQMPQPGMQQMPPPYYPQYQHQPRGSVAISIELKQIAAIIAAIIVVISVFLPFITFPIPVSLSLSNIGNAISWIMKNTPLMSLLPAGQLPPIIILLKYAWIIVLIFAVGAIAVSLFKQYPVLWVAAFGLMAMSLTLIITYFVYMGKINQLIAQVPGGATSPSGTHLSGYNLLPLGFGAVLMLVGSVMLTSTCFVRGQDE